jgi:RING-finger-containing ubiquitin ligase
MMNSLNHEFENMLVSESVKLGYMSEITQNHDAQMFNIILQKQMELLEEERIEARRKRKEEVWNKKYGNMCSICLEEGSVNVVLEPCYHTFHKSCLDSWKGGTCPNCRRYFWEAIFYD